MTACNQGATTRLALGITAGVQEIEFLEFDDQSQFDLVDNSKEAIRGTLEGHANRVTAGLERLRFKIRMNPSPSEMDLILPLIGTNENSTDNFSVVDGSGNSVAPPAFEVVVDRNTQIDRYTGCKVDRAIHRGQMGNAPVELILEIVGQTMSRDVSWEDSGANAIAAIGTPDICYAFTEGTLKLGSSLGENSDGLIEFDRYAIVIDNNLEVQYNNSRTPTNICASRRDIQLLANSPFVSATADLFNTPAGGDTTGFDSPNAYVKFTRSSANISTEFRFGNLKAIARPPSIPGKTEIRLDLAFQAYTTSSAAALVVVHDATTAS